MTKDMIIPANLYDDNHIIQRSTASSFGYNARKFVSWDNTGSSIRSDYTRSDYEYFRSEKLPKLPKDIIKFCNVAYKRNGIIRNVIDLMGDFSSQGIRLQHRIPSIERFYTEWFERVRGKDRSERFLNLLYRQANVPVNKVTGKLTIAQLKKMKKTYGIDNDGLVLPENESQIRTIPLSYTFLNLDNIDVAGGLVGSFSGRRTYTLRISKDLQTQMAKIKSVIQDEGQVADIMKSIPPYILEAIKNNNGSIYLDPTRFQMYFYKKDDWEDWAEPMTFPIMDDVIMFDKLKLADISALDGVISSVRLWKLGIIGDDQRTTIIPTPQQLMKLRDLLASGVGGGSFDLVWGPDLDFKETATNTHQFLGASKYEPVLDSIYDGLGIPPTLRSGKATTNSNNFIALKTLVERLNYGRDVLVSFWNNELKIVQEAMGFSEPATVVFEQMILSDEAAEKKLLMDLADRGIISDEGLRERFDLPHRVETARVKREATKRGKALPHKASPYHAATPEHDLRKLALQTGIVTPSEVGLELEEKKTGEESLQDKMVKIKKQEIKNKPKLPGGRPKNLTETKKRKPKPKVKVSSFINVSLWANSVQETISELVTPAILSVYGKKNVRSLTDSEFKELEEVKAGILFELTPYEVVDNEKVYKLLQVTPNNYLKAKATIVTLCGNHKAATNKDLSVAELRNIYSNVYALSWEEEDGEG